MNELIWIIATFFFCILTLFAVYIGYKLGKGENLIDSGMEIGETEPEEEEENIFPID